MRSSLNPISPGEPAPCVDVGTAQALVRSAQAGDVKSFERLYRLHAPRVLGLCLRMLNERAGAEDCTQKTFIKAWQHLGEFEGRSTFASWLHGIAVREVLSHRRTQSWLEFGVEFSDSEPQQGSAEKPTSMDVGMDGVFDIEHALRELPAGARFVVVLQAIYGYSHEEVAAMLGIAVGTCKAQLHRARNLLRAQLKLEN